MAIFISPSYADPDLPLTLQNAIRQSSGAVHLTFGICEQVTGYVKAFMVGRSLPAHVKATFVLYGEGLIGVGGARAAIERMYDGEEYMLMIDAGSVCFGGIAHVAIGTPSPRSKRNPCRGRQSRWPPWPPSS